MDLKENPETLKEFLKNNGISYPVVIDPDNSVVRQFGVRGIPTVLLIDRKGILRYQGFRLPEREVIDRML